MELLLIALILFTYTSCLSFQANTRSLLYISLLQSQVLIWNQGKYLNDDQLLSLLSITLIFLLIQAISFPSMLPISLTITISTIKKLWENGLLWMVNCALPIGNTSTVLYIYQTLRQDSQIIDQLSDNKTQKEGSGTYVNYPTTIGYAEEYTKWYIQCNNQIPVMYKLLCCHVADRLLWQGYCATNEPFS